MPSSTTLSMAIRQPNWSEADTLFVEMSGTGRRQLRAAKPMCDTELFQAELGRAQAELRAAKRAVDAMTIATSLEELREAWQNFLTRIEKVWTKAERECHSSGSHTL